MQYDLFYFLIFLGMLAGVEVEVALEYIIECINKQESILKVLRLLCLYSLTSNGLREKEYNFIRREILQTYGYRYLFALERLNKLGLCQKKIRIIENAA